MRLKNSLNFLNRFKNIINLKIKKFYFNTNYYDKKISKIKLRKFTYKPNPSILDCIVKYNKDIVNIEDLKVNNIWNKNNINHKSYKKLHNFFWLFSINLKSSNQIIQNILEGWIEENSKYNAQIWDADVLSKRVISWLSNSKLSYEDGNENYKKKFNFVIQKQVKHLINQINKSYRLDDNIVCCSAIILSGLSYQDKNFLHFGFDLLKKIINNCFDKELFPKSRNINQLVFYLKYLILIREFIKDSQNEIPDYLDEAIYYLGNGYKLFYGENKKTYLFNGNNEEDNSDLDRYLKIRGYKFKNNTNNMGDYGHFQNKKISIIMDLGRPPEKRFSENYQSGPLSFEFFYLGEKLICNSGYYRNLNHQLNKISRSTASHSTLIADNRSVSQFYINNNGSKYVDSSFKVFEKKILDQNEKWVLSGSHDGYLKKYGIIHKRIIEVMHKNLSIEGSDEILMKKNKKKINFEIRFHLYPGIKVTKTIDGKTILIEMGNSGWKFTCNDFFINYETGLFFGKKNKYLENFNIYISGEANLKDQIINWKLEKI